MRVALKSESIAIGLICILDCIAPLGFTHAQIACTSATAQSPVTAGNCADRTFDFYVQVSYADGSSKTISAGGAAASGVCAMSYPACNTNYPNIQVQEKMPDAKFTVFLDSVNQRFQVNWTISQPSITEAANACPCLSTDDPTANPDGFSNLPVGNLAPIVRSFYVSC
jgi:hypothetical protein